MRRARAERERPRLTALARELIDLGLAHGLHRAGVAPAEPYADTLSHLLDRKARGLHAGMAFTYRNPQRSCDPTRAVAGARALVVGARAYPVPAPPPPAGQPVGRVAAYARADHYTPLREALGAIAARLEADGYRARVLADDNALVDREAARRAGIGWHGKSANVLVPGFGSWVLLGSVVTDAPLPTRTAPVADGCGQCRRCLDACPTGAIIDAGVVDARRCLAWLVQAPGSIPREYRAALGDRLYGCDDCQEVCPPGREWSQRASARTAVDGDAGEAWVPLLELLSSDDDRLLERFGRWYVPQRDPNALRRNALVALGNVGDAQDATTIEAFERYLDDPDPLLREHAAWAAHRLGRRDLLERRRRDPVVAAELAHTVPPA